MGERVETLETKQDAPNVIVGMGPGGLAAALELAEAGHRVLILEKRPDFTRDQKIQLNLETVKHFMGLMDRRDYPKPEEAYFIEAKGQDEDFLDELEAAGGIIEIFKVQEFLKRQLEKYPELIQAKQSNKDVKIEVTKVTPVNTLQYLENGEEHEVQFKHLIAADGSGRETAAMVGLKDDHFLLNESQPRQEVHGAVTVELREGVVPRRKERELNFSDLADLQREPFRWDKPYLPRVYAWLDRTGKIYMAGEVPSAYLKLTGLTQQKALENWAKIILAKTCGYNKDKIGLNLRQEKAKRDKRQATVFPVTLKHAVLSVYECDPKRPGTHAFIQIGDASRNANFFIGHGTNDAIEDGIAVAKCMMGDTFDSATFDDRHKSVKARIVADTERISQKDREGFFDSEAFAGLGYSKSKDKHKKKQFTTLGYSQLTDENKKQLKASIKKIRKNILPCVSHTAQYEAISQKIKTIESSEKQNDYGAVLLAAEAVFNDVHTMLINDAERFSKTTFLEDVSDWFHSFSKETQQKPAKTMSKSQKASAKKDMARAKAVESKVSMLYQFIETAKSLDELAQLKALKPGQRLADKKPPKE